MKRPDAGLLRSQHWQQTEFWIAELDRVEKLDRPVCASCKEEWGANGCNAIRTLDSWLAAERENHILLAEASKLRAELGKVAALGEWQYNRAARRLDLRLQVAEEALRAGGIDLFDHLLVKMRGDFKKWYDEHTESWQQKTAKIFSETMANAARLR